MLPVGVAPASAERLNPELEVQRERRWRTQFIAALPVAQLGPPVASPDPESDTIFAAIDFVHHGW